MLKHFKANHAKFMQLAIRRIIIILRVCVWKGAWPKGQLL